MTTYEQYRRERQKTLDELPIFYAFSDEQFKKAMEKRGLTENDTDKIYKFGTTGGFYLRSDAEKIRAFCNIPDPLPDLMKDHDFAVSAFYYEMCNHEYGINYWQGDYDVISCFGKIEYGESKTYKDYLPEAGYDADTVNAYIEARRKYYKDAEEKEWF